MTDAGATPAAGALVCPFVALAEDRDRRADAPDERNRCYAEKAPRRRDLAYQEQYCYSPSFAACSVFLSWAARNAAEPAYVTDAARSAWASGVAAPESPPGAAAGAAEPAPFAWSDADATAAGTAPGAAGPAGSPYLPTVEGGLFGPAEPGAAPAAPSAEDDWVSASAWAAAPWDPDAEEEVEELVAVEPPEDEEAVLDIEDRLAPGADEPLQAPKVPAALPMRRRRGTQAPIRARGSGEWLYADPLAREPLARRRGSIGPPIMLAVLGLLVIALVAFLLPALLGGGGGQQVGALPSGSPGATLRPAVTRAPSRTARPSASPSVPPEPRIRVYTVKAGNTLSGIADRFDVSMRLIQCLNVITNPNSLQVGQQLLIPPEGYSCPPGWRNMTPPPIPE